METMTKTKAVKYYEVEGAVLRESATGQLEIYTGKDTWKAYTGDPDRIYRQSNVMSLEEVQPYMD